MKPFSAVRARVVTILGVIAVTCLLAGALSSRAVSAQPGPAVPKPTFESQEAWRAFMAQVPMPLKGCFTAGYPDTAWHEVPCTTAPKLPYPPARAPRSDTVGNGNDYSAQVNGTHLISTATGSFASVTGVTSETGDVNGMPPARADAFSLQLNSNFFASSENCNPMVCSAWQQFILSNRTCQCAFMQYWLLNYGDSCPPNWSAWDLPNCYTNSSAVMIPLQHIANLRNLSITGKAVSGGNDTLILSTGNRLYTLQGEDSVLDLALGWQAAEFNLVGDCCGVEADFNAGSTIVVKTAVDSGYAKSPACMYEGFTGETNNLNLVRDPKRPLPQDFASEILFMESNGTGANSGQFCYSFQGGR